MPQTTVSHEPLEVASSDQIPRRRRSSQEAVDRIAVRKALTDLVRRIAKLQHEAAFLRAIWERPARRDCILPRVISIGHEAQQTVEEFQALVEDLLPRQRENSRILDIERSLRTLIASIPRVDEVNVTANNSSQVSDLSAWPR